MKKIYLLLVTVISVIGCSKPKTEVIQGKIEREQIGIVSKIPGKIIEIRIQEGDFVRKGDTLAILDIPEVDAKKSQAEGAVQSAKAQYDMTLKGATDNQLKQLEAKQKALKEQYELAQKSINRLSNMLKDSLVSQQMYDEAFAKYQGAQSQYLAVQAEISDVKYGARIEQQKMALGQQERALGALQEVSVADSERYIIAPQDMTVESITLKAGELALPGYTLISGTISESTYFRFTIPESRLSKVQKGQEVTVNIVYNKSQVKGKITSVKALGAYANIATAYPDYEIQESLFEIKISPIDVEQAKDLFTKTTVTLELLK
ncbi:HlyD family secretion protein [Xanthomarina gelatinilytica]|uniref:HlyD family secretion protein n=1 Tax=Xanthomarina gelatinilytica TaxID=1137281 RepID=M7MXX0_9FLAO|nr:biotin/lipoyl-binding protein [Xanthomarina gelatinilytica]EMQ94319.1 HlyD family secretion protein [Xanthomarina gelatinilytica]